MIKRTNAAFLVCLLLSVLAVEGVYSRPQSGQATKSNTTKLKVRDGDAKLDKWKVHYQSYGKGPDALVFVHGWACNLTFWDSNVPAFAGKQRVIAVDLIGHGMSDKPQVTYTMDLFAKSIAVVLKHAGVKRAVLVGHSMGTPVVRQFYRDYPQQALALVFVDGSLRSFGTPEQVAPMINAFKGPNYKQFVEQFITTLTNDVASKNELQHITTAMLSTPQNVIVGGMEAMADPGIWKDDQIKIPVLAINARGPEWTPDYFAYVHQLVPDVEVQVWDGVSHFLMMDEPQKFNSAIAGFLTKKSLLK